MKIVLITARNFFVRGDNNDKGILSIASDEDKNRIGSEIIPALDQLIKETELGIIDYKKLKDAEPDNKDVTHRLTELYAGAGAKFRSLMNKPAEAEEDEFAFEN